MTEYFMKHPELHNPEEQVPQELFDRAKKGFEETH